MFLDKEPSWDDESMKQVYVDWLEHVKNVVPSDKLLVFNVKQGWEPLCKFLNVPGKSQKISFKPQWSVLLNDKFQFLSNHFHDVTTRPISRKKWSSLIL